MKRREKLRPLFVLAVAAGAAALLYGLGLARGKTDTTVDHDTLVVAEVATLRQADGYDIVHHYTGQVVARREGPLAFERTGLLAEIVVDEGDRVEEGQTLARLDTRRLAAERLRNAAEEQQAKAVLDEMLAGPRQQTIDQARAHVKELEARAERARLRVERLTATIMADAVSQDELDAADFAHQAAVALLESARHALDELLEGTRKEKILAQKAAAQALAARSAAIDVDLDLSELRAPFAGVVQRRMADEGSVANPGQEILTLVETDHLELWFGLSADIANGLEPDQTVEVSISGQQRQARFHTRLPRLDQATRTVRVIFSLEGDQAAGVIVGQIARFSVARPMREPGFWIDNTALVRAERGLWAVYLLEKSDGTTAVVRRAHVEVLHLDNERVFARGTLQDGDRIVATGTHRIVAGQTVRIAAPRE